MQKNRRRNEKGGTPVHTLALIVNIHKQGARAACADLFPFLMRKGISVIADKETADLLKNANIAREEREIRSESDLVIAIGGDGTVLKAARMLSGARIPLLGINLGGMGFLSAATHAEARKFLDRALKGEYRAEERLLLSVRLVRGGKEIIRRIVLNDVVIARGALSRLVALETFIDDEYLVTFLADGLIVATPTGSTAYSLSAGGPLVSPDTDAIIITPICPHMLTNRPLIVPSRRIVRVAVTARGHDSTLTFDGQGGESLREGDEVVISGYGEKLTLVVPPEKSYFHLLREKLHWGGRVHHG
ncbi:MAG: NAD(+)/NADH kinase [Candidatus Aureabacteria bacterium]|nr:NAD(+)/NADH kinase [Candidatus Auribacterota bacterium]